MTKSRMLESKGDPRTRYPAIFNRPLRSRLTVPSLFAVAAAIFVFGLVDLDFSPARMLSGLHQLGWFVLLMIPPDPGSSLPTYLKAMGETLSIAVLGTTLAAVAALPVSLLAARNVIPSAIFRFPVRRFLDSIRGIDQLIWALVWINVVGLGPFAGVLAIAVSDFGAFGKLFSEAIEAADRKPVSYTHLDVYKRQPIIMDAEMRHDLGQRVGALIEGAGIGKTLGRQPGAAHADRCAISETQGLDPGQQCAGLHAELFCELPRCGLGEGADQLSARLAATGPDDFRKPGA